MTLARVDADAIDSLQMAENPYLASVVDEIERLSLSPKGSIRKLAEARLR